MLRTWVSVRFSFQWIAMTRFSAFSAIGAQPTLKCLNAVGSKGISGTPVRSRLNKDRRHVQRVDDVANPRGNAFCEQSVSELLGQLSVVRSRQAKKIKPVGVFRARRNVRTCDEWHAFRSSDVNRLCCFAAACNYVF